MSDELVSVLAILFLLDVTLSAPRVHRSRHPLGVHMLLECALELMLLFVFSGRKRRITKVGRKSMVTYKGQQISLGEARKLERRLAKGL